MRPREGTYAPRVKMMEVVVYDLPSAQANAKLSNGRSSLKTSYDATAHALHVLIPDVAGQAELRIGN